MEQFELISKLKNLQQKLSSQSSTHEKETQTSSSEFVQLRGFNLLPKKIIRKIFIFSDFLSDGPSLYSTCRLFNSVIRSRVFQVLLHHQVTNKRSNVLSSNFNTSDEEVQKLRPESEIKTKEEAVGQLRVAENLKQVLASKLKRQDNKNNDLEAEIARIQEEIKAQKSRYSKGIEKMNDIDSKHESEKKVLVEAQKNLMNLKNKCKKEIDDLRAQINECEMDKEKLLLEKRVLRAEVLELRESNVEIQKEIVVYQEVLNKIKAYFLGMEEAGLIKLTVDE
jgi:DNA repair exonuclease SbcCD ATPase subunit